MVDTSSFEKLRPCGRLETLSTSRHHLGFFNNEITSASYHNPTSTIPIKSLIYNALPIVIARHSVLTAIPIKEDESYPHTYFARIPSFDLEDCVQFLERRRKYEGEGPDHELDRIIQEQHALNFKEKYGTKPVWRIIVLHTPGDLTTFTILWIFHHALADGTSGLRFHQALLSAISTTTTTEKDITTFVQSPKTPLLPPLESLHPLPLSPLFILRALLSLILPSIFARRPAKIWTGAPISSSSTHLPFRARSLVLSSKTTGTLLRLSRENKTTLQGTLQCILAAAVFSTLDAQKYTKLRITGPVSLRQFMKWEGGELNDEIIDAVSEYSYLHTRAPNGSPKFSWDEARAVRGAIKAELDKRGKNSKVGLLRFVSDIHQFFITQVGRERTYSVELSNLGAWKKVPEDEVNGWRVGRCAFSQSPSITGAAIHASAVTGGDGCAVVYFTWQDSMVEDALVEAVIRSVDEEVEKLFGSKE